MRRFFRYMMIGLLAMATASCAEDSFVQYNPEKAVAPVLEGPEADTFVLTEDISNDVFGTFSFTEADFGMHTAIRYTLYVDLKGNEFSSAKKYKSLETPLGDNPVFAPTVKEINTLVLNLIKSKTAEDAELNPVADVEFRLTAEWMGEGNPVGISLHSNVISANITVFVAETAEDDYSIYPKVWVIGDYCGWGHGSSLFLYNLEGDEANYQGVVDFGEKAANGWKITGAASWDDATGNWGAPASTDPESASLTLENGSSNNITCYSKRFYHFTFNKNDLKVTMNLGFNEVGIIGLADDWTEGVSMSFDPAKQRFYADVEVSADTKFKFWFDKDWDVYDLGGDMSSLTKGGTDIEISAGNYRIYLDMTNFAAPKAKLSAEMYGKEEGTSTPEPEPGPGEGDEGEGGTVTILCEATGWDVTNLYGWEFGVSFNWPGVPADGTVTLSGKEYSYWTLTGVDMTATAAGLIFNNGSVQTVDIAPVAMDGNKCFKVGEAGADGKLRYEELEVPSIRISYTNEAGWSAVSMYGWGDLGDFGGWPGVAMTQEGDLWVSYLPVSDLGKSTSLIFNNAGAGAQTVDLGPFVLEGDLAFDSSNAAIK